jgi:two-component system cell cycle response regulator
MTHKSTILIVDDEPSARETLEALLFREGYHLVYAADGAEALQKAVELIPDLILLDVMMPGMDGFEVCRRLRADPRLAEAPVIMVTALDDRDSRIQGIEAGADDFVSKPFDRAELRARARAITRLNRYRRLLLERAKFEWVVEQADDGYLILDGNDRILYANPRARLYLGLPAALAEEGAPADTAFLALARQQYRCEPQELWSAWPAPPAAAQALCYLVRPRSASSGEFWLQVNLTEMHAPTGLVYPVRLRDVTASVKTQLNVWTFQSLVSHKLRTPLGIITGFLDVLVEDLSAVLDEESHSCLKAIQDKALELQNQVLGILRYVETPATLNVEAGRCRLAELPALVAEIGDRLEIGALTITHDDVDLDVYAPFSHQALELILWELLENAKKFHPHRSPTVEVKLSPGAEGVRLQIGDDGATLSPVQLVRIWTPYYQAESGFSGAVPGMGLGLAMVAALVWRVGGTCRARNRERGAGIAVELSFPVEKTHGYTGN